MVYYLGYTIDLCYYTCCRFSDPCALEYEYVIYLWQVCSQLSEKQGEFGDILALV